MLKVLDEVLNEAFSESLDQVFAKSLDEAFDKSLGKLLKQNLEENRIIRQRMLKARPSVRGSIICP